jgi:hypothetical protein
LVERVKRGYRQSPEHVAKRIRTGADHHAWMGAGVSEKGGRSRALRAFPVLQPCEECGTSESERHHVNGDTADNTSTNIRFLCRRCHMKTDGRLNAFTEMAKARSAEAVEAAAASRRARTTCKRGHPLTGENLYVTPDGKRVCKECRKLHKKNSRRRTHESH